MDDEKITALFWERSQEALVLLDKKYGGIPPLCRPEHPERSQGR